MMLTSSGTYYLPKHMCSDTSTLVQMQKWGAIDKSPPADTLSAHTHRRRGPAA